MYRRSRLVSMLPLLGICAFLACTQFDGVADKLDKVARSVEEFGTISISSPLLFQPSATTRFAFDLRRTAQEYYDDAKKVQGASAAFLQESVDTQFGATFRFNYNDYLKDRALLSGFGEDLSAFKLRQDLTNTTAMLSALAALSKPTSQPTTQPYQLLEAQAQAMSLLLSGLAGPTSRPGFPELAQNPPPLESPLPTTRPAQKQLVAEKFKDFQGLLNNVALTAPSRASIVTASGDHLTQALMNFLPNPVEAMKFHGKRLYFAVMMVSVQPGDRTYRGYRADVSMSASFGRTKGSALTTLRKAQNELRAAAQAINSAGKTKKGVGIDAYCEQTDDAMLKAKWAIDRVADRSKTVPELSEALHHLKQYSNRLKARVEAKLNSMSEVLTSRVVPDSIKGNLKQDISNLYDPTLVPTSGPVSDEAMNAILKAQAAFANADGSGDPAELEPLSSSVGDITSVLAGYGGKDFEQIGDRASPLIAAVSPMTDAQALDLKSSNREQQAYALRIAMALSGLGANAQAEFFRDWVRRLERDSATLTNLNAVTSYSVAGGIFGYQIAPRLQALSDLSGKDPEPDLIMQPLSFPVLVIIGVDQRDLEVYDIDCIAFQQTSRWLRAGNPAADRRPFGRGLDRAFTKPRLSEQDMMLRAFNLDEAKCELKKVRGKSTKDDGTSVDYSATESYLHNRIETLGFLAGTSSGNWQTLDTVMLDDPPPAFAGVWGAVAGDTTTEKEVVLYGDHLDQLDLDVSHVGVIPPVCAIANISKDAGFIRVKMKTTKVFMDAGQVALGFSHPDNGGGAVRAIVTPPIEIKPVPTPSVVSITPTSIKAGDSAKLVLSGTDLNSLFDKDAKPLFVVEVAPGGAGGEVKGVSRLGDGIQLTYQSDKDLKETRPVYFLFKHEKIKSLSVITPYVTVAVKCPEVDKKSLALERKTEVRKGGKDEQGREKSESATTTETLTLPEKAITLPVKLDAEQINKLLEKCCTTQPASNASVNVSVNASGKSQ